MFRRSKSTKPPSFHKQRGSTVRIQSPEPKLKNTKPKESPFVQELVLTGRPNWDKAPPQLKQRYKGIFLVLLSVPVIFITSFEMYQRLEGQSTKKIQQGEKLPNGGNRDFDEIEKYKVEKESVMYKLFGRDFFLDGFTSKTMKADNDDKNR
ncbi:hypothetical protein CORT_0D01670 [Candida orthopsilosis Co 90-125]|uniref:Uncharacterized protein n=1 Tax=Candida orthopsilosis (strain 90-125) TaxID=1136231 RepID=H8X4S3_CANO9|nr:hypothetical protein CORT_0D01670 [Candida orthopsilosis Co 90-125]CCG23015.1 hypothetical protein CORT_0D01670 [Candida orthopsilosis Co 90-125]